MIRQHVFTVKDFRAMAEAGLFIEVSNTKLSEDLGKKLKRYASLGIQDYWVANIKDKVWLVHREPSGEAYMPVTKLPFGSSLAPLAFSDDARIWL